MNLRRESLRQIMVKWYLAISLFAVAFFTSPGLAEERMQGVDAVLVMDSTGSMKKTDPLV